MSTPVLDCDETINFPGNVGGSALLCSLAYKHDDCKTTWDLRSGRHGILQFATRFSFCSAVQPMKSASKVDVWRSPTLVENIVFGALGKPVLVQTL